MSGGGPCGRGQGGIRSRGASARAVLVSPPAAGEVCAGCCGPPRGGGGGFGGGPVGRDGGEDDAGGGGREAVSGGRGAAVVPGQPVAPVGVRGSKSLTGVEASRVGWHDRPRVGQRPAAARRDASPSRHAAGSLSEERWLPLRSPRLLKDLRGAVCRQVLRRRQFSWNKPKRQPVQSPNDEYEEKNRIAAQNSSVATPALENIRTGRPGTECVEPK